MMLQKNSRGTLKLPFLRHQNAPQQIFSKFVRASENCKIYLFFKLWIWGKNMIPEKGGGNTSLTTNIHPLIYV